MKGESDIVGTLNCPGWSWRQTDAKRLALDEEVERSQLFFSGGKDDWQKFWKTTLDQRSKRYIDQKEREPTWQEATLLLMRWTKDDLAFLVVLEQMLR